MIYFEERCRLPSRWPDGSLMYPGEWLLVWGKCAHMPAMLISMQQVAP